MIREITTADWRADRFPLLHDLTRQYATECAKIGFFVENIKFSTVDRAEVSIKSPNYSAEEVAAFRDAVDAAETNAPGSGSGGLHQGQLDLDGQDGITKRGKARSAVNAAIKRGMGFDAAVEAVCVMTGWDIKQAIKFAAPIYHESYKEKLREYAPETDASNDTDDTDDTTGNDGDPDTATGEPWTTNECEDDLEEIGETEGDTVYVAKQQKGE